MLLSFPDEAQEYLKQKYGLRPYSRRYLQDLIAAGRFPKPLRTSPQRRALSIEALDAHAARVLSEAQEVG